MRDSPLAQDFIEEGKQDPARAASLRFPRHRFGEDAEKEFEPAVNGLTNLKQFDALLEIAARGRRVSQFRRAIGQL